MSTTTCSSASRSAQRQRGDEQRAVGEAQRQLARAATVVNATHAKFAIHAARSSCGRDADVRVRRRAPSTSPSARSRRRRARGRRTCRRSDCRAAAGTIAGASSANAPTTGTSARSAITSAVVSPSAIVTRSITSPTPISDDADRRPPRRARAAALTAVPPAAARATRAPAASSRARRAAGRRAAVELDLLAQPRAERLERALRVVAAPVEAAVDEPLHARAQRQEQRRHDERRGGDRQVRAAGERREHRLPGEHEPGVRGAEQHREQAVDERARDQQVDVEEPVAQDRDRRPRPGSRSCRRPRTRPRPAPSPREPGDDDADDGERRRPARAASAAAARRHRRCR